MESESKCLVDDVLEFVLGIFLITLAMGVVFNPQFRLVVISLVIALGLYALASYLVVKATEKKTFKDKLESLVKKGDRRKVWEILTDSTLAKWQIESAFRALGRINLKSTSEGQ